MKSEVLHSEPSQPIMGILVGRVASLKLLKATQKIYEEIRPGQTTLQFHKARLGPQSFCFLGSERRLYVWERPDWRVFVANGFGFALEIKADRDQSPTFLIQASWSAFRQYRKELGIPG